MRSVLLLMAASVLPLSSHAASFDCAMAKKAVEKKICSDPLLSRLDDALAANYQAMLSVDVGRSRKALRTEQRRWLAQRDRCTSMQCLVQHYRDQLDATCDYGVVSGVHPVCTLAQDVQ
ncbi:MAG: lysozyme inhibitor LprI family protein [Giesbergeria sp.]